MQSFIHSLTHPHTQCTISQLRANSLSLSLCHSSFELFEKLLCYSFKSHHSLINSLTHHHHITNPLIILVSFFHTLIYSHIVRSSCFSSCIAMKQPSFHSFFLSFTHATPIHSIHSNAVHTTPRLHAVLLHSFLK